MSKDVVGSVQRQIKQKGIPITAVAAAEELNRKAPEGFRPEDLLPGAKSMLIFAKPLPLAVYLAPNDPDFLFYTRSFLTSYQVMDETANAVCLTLEEAGFLSLPLPAYGPMRFHEGEPKGLVSFKHAAAEAGLGKMGKNTLLIHPEHGNILRFGGLLTTMELTPGKPQPFPKLCPAKCRLCEEACPVGALDNGSIDKTRCMGNCIKHTLMPPQRLLPSMKGLVGRSRKMTHFMELFSHSLFGSYGIGCMACLLACPHFPGRKLKRKAA